MRSGLVPQRPLSKTRRRVLWAVAVCLSLASLALSIWLLGSPPPRRIRLGTGDPSGGFAALGSEYRARLEPMGLHVDLVESHGSVENLRRLARGEVDIAFAQTGVAQALDTTDGLCTLAAVGTHPLWIFSPSTAPIVSLHELAGHKVIVGPQDSGTEALARLLLQEYGVTDGNATLLHASMENSRQALTDGAVAGAFMVCASEVPVIRQLLGEPRVRLNNLAPHQLALSQRFRYLRRVTLPRGVLDLEHDVPAEDIRLLAPTIQLVAHDDLHPRVVEQFLRVAQTVHASGNRLEHPGEFPSLEATDLPPHLAAEKFMRSGESLATRLLPYWGVRLFWQGQLLLLPLLALLLPFWRTLPLLYSFRINRILRHHYKALRDLETRIETCADVLEMRKLLEALTNLRTDLESLSRKLPAHLQRDVYHWRSHVALVRAEACDRLDRLQRLSQGGETG
jgi:uncharacterized protein